MQPPFELKDLIKVFALNILLYAVFVLLFGAFPGVIAFMDGLNPTLNFLIQYLIQFIILFLPLFAFVVDHYSANLEDFGFHRVPIKRSLKIILGTYFVFLLLSFVWGLLMIQLDLQVPGYEAQQSYLPFFGDDLAGYIVAGTFIVIVAPFLEELFFRGFIYRVFTKNWPVPVASVLTASLFALIHFQLANVIPLFILGLLLNFVYQRSGSVWVAVAFHALNNAVAFGIDFYITKNPEFLQQLPLEQGLQLLYNGTRLLF